MTTDEAKESGGNLCSRCSTPTSNRCGGCSGAPVYNHNPVPHTFYCSNDCQRAGWDRHKRECKALQARKSLVRAATILQEIMYRIRKNAYPITVSSVQHDAGRIAINSPEEEDPDRSPGLQPFPADLVKDADLLRPICLHACGVEAKIYLSSFVPDLLHDICTIVEEVDVVSTNPKIRISSNLNPAADARRQIYKVTMRNQETWAIDVSGAQYGYPNSLTPWAVYLQDHCELNMESSLSSFADHHLSILGFLLRLPSGIMKQMRSLTAEIDWHHMPELAAAHGGSLSALLRGPETTFTSGMQRFLDELETRVQLSLANPMEEIAHMFSLLHAWNDDETLASGPDQQYYRIKAAPGKGQGMFARSRIPKGTRLLSEAPIFTLPRNNVNLFLVSCNVERLSPAQREAFFALHNTHRGGARHSALEALGITRTNALPLGADASEGGVFLEASRINHSCRQNAQNTWNASLGRLTVHAIRDIEEGEEVTTTYLSASQNRATRQARLRASFGFVCACEQCSLPAAQLRQSDDRLDEMARLDGRLGDGIGIVSTPLSCLRNAHKMWRLMQQEDIVDARVPRVYYDAFQIVIANGDQARAKVFAERAYAGRAILEGSDSPEVVSLKKYVEQTAAHRLYGTTTKWKQNVTKVPQGLSEQEFEKWLWRLPGYSS